MLAAAGTVQEMDAFVVRHVGSDEIAGLQALAMTATDEGIRNVGALVEQWASGQQRFEADGEALLIASDRGGHPIGVGGLTRCPHVDGALRARRFYVDPDWRRRGVASSMATQLLALGDAHVDVITCNAAASAAAPMFWEALGFVPIEHEGITHIRTR